MDNIAGPIVGGTLPPPFAPVLPSGDTLVADAPAIRMVLADWDNTLRRGFTMVDWTRFLATHGHFPQVTARTIAHAAAAYGVGTISYRELATTVTGLYRDGLTGQSTATIASLAEQFVRSDTGLFGFVEPFVRLVREYGLRLVVVSGSPVEPLLAYRRRLSIDRVYGLTVGTAHGRYTSTIVSDPTLGGEKARIVDDLAPGSHIVLALGDSPADLPLLAAAPLSVVVDNPGLDPGASTDVHHISATSLADARRILEGVTVSAALG